MLSLQLWAKSYPDDPSRFHPLWCHLLDVAAVCEALLPRFGGIGLPGGWVPYLVALHDIGKSDARFQGKAPGLVPALVAGALVEQAGLCTGFRHEARSAEWIAPHLEDRFGWGISAARVVGQAIRGHHGDFQAGTQIGASYTEQEYEQFHGFYPPLRDQLASLVAEALRLPHAALDIFPDASVAGMRLSGLIVLSDWIASNPETYHYPTLYPKDAAGVEPDAYLTAARVEALEAVQRLELDAAPGVCVPVRPTFAEVWPECRTLRPSQHALEEAVRDGVPPGLTIIEAPMGEGKTEMALYLAACWNRRGAYIALPTQATSNQMHRRYVRFLHGRDPDGPPPRLVHGMAWLQDPVTPEQGARVEDPEERLLSREWFASAKRALLAADGVGTVDQVLMAALNVKHGFLRFLGLTTKTLIIDEVHAYDLYMTTLMKMLLRWCRALDVPVILLSATLSQAQKWELAEAYGGPGSLPALASDAAEEPYPLLTFVPREGQSFVRGVPADPSRDRVIQIEPHAGVLDDAVETARLAAKAVAQGGCACVLANTVRAAQEIFQALQADPPADTRLLLFHARFRAGRRIRLEKLIVRLFGKGRGPGKNPNRPKKAILVATQVVEQSLDLDFDVMLSQIAPIDLLLQRCGRLHRHSENDPRPTSARAVLHVFLPPPGKPDFKGMEIKPDKAHKNWRGVYDRAALLRTMALLESRTAINLPADFRPLIEGCYDVSRLPVSSFPAEWITDAEKLRADRQAQSEQKAKRHLVAEPSPRLFKYAQKTEQPVTEGEENEQASFFRAQTREGDDSRAVLILHDPRLIAAVRAGCALEAKPDQEWHPGKSLLKDLFLQKASLPTYWLAGVPPADGYDWIEARAAPKRLRHHDILIMRGKAWKGIRTGRGEQAGKVTNKLVTITDDDVLGLRWAEEKEEDDTEI